MMAAALMSPSNSTHAVPSRRVLPLPQPQTTGGMALTEALRRRRSRRAFDDQQPSDEQVGQLCWAAQGVTDTEARLHVAPSAGAIYPCVLLLVSPRGVFEYLPQHHALRPLSTDDLRPALHAAALNQECVGDAPLCFVIAVNARRTAWKYGRRAQRYCLLEAGHIAQNILLQATAAGLASAPIGAFDDDGVAEALRLPAELRPVYLIPVGTANV